MMENCQAAGVPAGVVQNVHDFVSADPQLSLSGFMHEIDATHPAVGKTWADKLPIHFQGTPCDVYERPRALGEDNQAVLQDWLGLSEDEVQKVEADGILN